MARSLILGNGNLLIGLDKTAQVRDLYFPHVGLENHTGGKYLHRVGVWVDGMFSWLGSEWDIVVSSETDSLIGHTVATNAKLGVVLNFEDAVYNEKDIFIRKVSVQNTSNRKRTIKLYFAHEFEIYENVRGDSAYYDPKKNVIVHYNGRRMFLIDGRVDGRGFDDYTIGIFGIEGKAGSFLDAEDGVLSKNPVEHGLTDSVVGFYMDIEANEQKIVNYWMSVAKSMSKAYELDIFVDRKTPEYLIKTTKDFWMAWVNRHNFDLIDLKDDAVTLFKKSLFIIRAHTDNSGAILASSDSDMLQHGRDTYAYMWPRDGARVALSLDMAGSPNIAKRFFEFATEIMADEGYFFHKYRPDGAMGSSWHPWIRDGKLALPIQEDETALVLCSLWDHYETSKDLEFIESVYDTLIKRAADFLIAYRSKDTGLPMPSYDLWEEKWGISTYTCSTVYGALRAAEKFANLLGKTTSAQEYSTVAESIQESILQHLYDVERGIFYKMVNFENGEKIIDDVLDMSTLFGLVSYDVLDIDDPRLDSFVEYIKGKVCCNADIGGAARYMGDKYFSIAPEHPGNPWIITTLWLAQYYIKKAKSNEDLDAAREWIRWVVEHATSTGMLPEQLNPYTGDPLSASPLTWSHAEYVITVIQYLDKMEELGLCDDCNPLNSP